MQKCGSIDCNVFTLGPAVHFSDIVERALAPAIHCGTGYPGEYLHRLDSRASSVRAPPRSCLPACVKGARERTSPQTARHTSAGPDFPFSCGFRIYPLRLRAVPFCGFVRL
ncbi:hypothetical protein SUGI_0601060 [Cryptomeria japonica]|nr:hypothetical protein SUGI_0601060 [Cryptomeria japonica]